MSLPLGFLMKDVLFLAALILPAQAGSDARGAGDNTELMGCDIAFTGSLAAVAE